LVGERRSRSCEQAELQPFCDMLATVTGRQLAPAERRDYAFAFVK
jgi:hypothetical protein